MLQDIGEVVEAAGAAGGDHRDFDRGGYGRVQGDVITGGRAVTVHAGQEDLARAERMGATRPLDGIQAGRIPAAVREDLPLPGGYVLRVDRHDDALAAELPGGFLDERGILDRRSIQRDLVGAGVEHRPDVLDGAEPAADGQRHEDLVGRALHDVDHGATLVARGGDIEEDQLIGALFLVRRGDRHRIAGVTELRELDPLDDASGMDVETRDDADGKHG